MKLSLKPQTVSDSCWYYEERKGIQIIYEIRDKNTDAYIRTDQILIPWRKIIASVKRYGEEK